MKISTLRVTLVIVGSLFGTGVTHAQTGAPSRSDGENPNLIELSWSTFQPASLLAEFGAAQEDFQVFENYLRGGGLPELEQQLFAAVYNELAELIVADRIEEPNGRIFKAEHIEILRDAHEILEDSEDFQGDFAAEIQPELETLREEIQAEAIGADEIPLEMLSPTLNGQQFWMEDVVFWGRLDGRITSGQYNRITRAALDLEKDEDAAKADEALSNRERTNLHEEAIRMNRSIISLVRK